MNQFYLYYNHLKIKLNKEQTATYQTLNFAVFKIMYPSATHRRRENFVAKAENLKQSNHLLPVRRRIFCG